MRIHHTTATWLAIVALAATGASQSAAKLKKELKQRESAAGKADADALVEIATWAKTKGLLKDANRLLKKALKIDPDHAGANTALGLVKFGDEWVTRAKAKVLEQKAHDAAMKDKGFVQVEGVWVDKEKLADAKNGTFWHEGAKVSRDEKRALMMGRVRHPRTGVFIQPEHLSKAEAGLFPTDSGWVSEDQANQFHSDRNHPWVVRTQHATLLSCLPIAKIDEFTYEVDRAIEAVVPVFNGQHAPPSHRPAVWISATAERYRDFGNATQSGGESAYGAFLSASTLNVPNLGEVRPAFFDNEKNWGVYYCRHAAALAYAASFCAAHGVEAPEWFLRGVGSLAERFIAPGDTAHFGKQHIAKGGVRTLKSWFSAFAIDGGMEPKERDYAIFQAGLNLDFAMRGGDAKATAAMQELSETIVKNPKKAEKAFEAFKKQIIASQEGIREYLQKVSK